MVQTGHGDIRQRELLREGKGSRKLDPVFSSLPSLGPLPPPHPNTRSAPLLEGDSAGSTEMEAGQQASGWQ